MAALTSREATGPTAPVATSLVIPSPPPQSGSRSSRFHLTAVARSAAVVMYGDVCKETCKSPTPTTCKLECHSGAPFTDLHEDVPPALC